MLAVVIDLNTLALSLSLCLTCASAYIQLYTYMLYDTRTFHTRNLMYLINMNNIEQYIIFMYETVFI